MTASMEVRRELKFVLPRAARPAFESWLRRSPALFSATFPQRAVHSVYAETSQWTNYSANLDGLSERAKLRLRWYGTDNVPDVIRLESKLKRAASTIKSPFELPGINLADLTWSQLNQHLIEHCPSTWSNALSMLRSPVSGNRYLRRYYLARDQSIRLTVDTDLVVRDLINSTLVLGGTERHVSFDIVEIKLQKSDIQKTTAIFADFPARTSRISKYVLGIQGSFG